jgi:hypothetical protein
MADPVRRMEIFEEMRASDDAVHGAIDARRQEINAANWVLSTEDKTRPRHEILEFVEDNLYPVLDDLLRWLGGGALQYGFGASSRCTPGPMRPSRRHHRPREGPPPARSRCAGST